MKTRPAILLLFLLAFVAKPWSPGGEATAAPNDLFGPPYPAPPQEESCNSKPAPPVLINPAPVIRGTPPVLTVPITPAPTPTPAVPQPGILPAPPLPAPTGPPPGPLEKIAPSGTVSPQFGLPPGPEVAPGVPTAILVPVTDDDFAWDAIADVVSDYFPITTEQRARRGPEVWSEGLIETAYRSGATLLEPHRHDSVGWFNLWESTFQTIRRRAIVHVIPEGDGYLIEVEVQKELEDLRRPEQGTANAATFDDDSSLPSYRTAPVSHTQSSPCWISLGRDTALEQRMLADIHARLAGAATTGSVFPAVAP
jgi:hypothetical protein